MGPTKSFELKGDSSYRDSSYVHFLLHVFERSLIKIIVKVIAIKYNLSLISFNEVRGDNCGGTFIKRLKYGQASLRDTSYCTFVLYPGVMYNKRLRKMIALLRAS